MSVGRPRWTSPSTSSIVCWTWDARAISASPDPDRVGVSATAPMIRAPRWHGAETLWAGRVADREARDETTPGLAQDAHRGGCRHGPDRCVGADAPRWR